MSDTLHYTKVVEGLKGFINKKRKENTKSKVILKVFDGIEETSESLTYEKAIPEFSVIDQELLFPDYLRAQIIIDGQVIKNKVIKDLTAKPSQQQTTTNTSYPAPPAMENNMMQFMFTMMQQSNSLLAESQRANMQAILDTTTKNAEAQSQRNLDSFKSLLEIEQAKSKNALEMERDKFLFELEKRETLDALGKDSTTLADLLNKFSGIVEKVPMPIWSGFYKKFTGQEMPGFSIPSGEDDSEIEAIVKEAMNK